LASTFANAVTTYALARVDEERARRKATTTIISDDSCLNISLTSLLIGSGEAGLSVADSLQAMLRGVRQANLRLKGLNQTKETIAGSIKNPTDRSITAFIDKIDFIELWKISRSGPRRRCCGWVRLRKYARPSTSTSC
jgi:hypothetical protein